jgi:hypothetical protein
MTDEQSPAADGAKPEVKKPAEGTEQPTAQDDTPTQGEGKPAEAPKAEEKPAEKPKNPHIADIATVIARLEGNTNVSVLNAVGLLKGAIKWLEEADKAKA